MARPADILIYHRVRRPQNTYQEPRGFGPGLALLVPQAEEEVLLLPTTHHALSGATPGGSESLGLKSTSGGRGKAQLEPNQGLDSPRRTEAHAEARPPPPISGLKAPVARVQAPLGAHAHRLQRGRLAQGEAECGGVRSPQRRLPSAAALGRPPAPRLGHPRPAPRPPARAHDGPPEGPRQAEGRTLSPRRSGGRAQALPRGLSRPAPGSGPGWRRAQRAGGSAARALRAPCGPRARPHPARSRSPPAAPGPRRAPPRSPGPASEPHARPGARRPGPERGAAPGEPDLPGVRRASGALPGCPLAAAAGTGACPAPSHPAPPRPARDLKAAAGGEAA
ncbi:basic proline-rich protein-like [Hippopotamus amphibius kiboko]|uniref:basic proline-rich protein-like n=1 Tax=Hippopotamus amphibius kiboko TaxID=575201 RepID=UPI00259558EC|nr:basic proline-rich protein-like [Hippopotamus amphibius kiboko]